MASIIQQSNELIAKFMGAKIILIRSHTPNVIFTKHPDSSRRFCNSDNTELHPRHLSYHKNYNWLIPVGQKILSDVFRKDCIARGFDPWMENNVLDEICDNKWDIDKLYVFIVQFIEWYNEQKK